MWFIAVRLNWKSIADDFIIYRHATVHSTDSEDSTNTNRFKLSELSIYKAESLAIRTISYKQITVLQGAP